MTYGAIAAHAAQLSLPDPAKITIKGPDQLWLIGTELKNRDVPLKVTGKAVYGIDVDLPGMLYAAVKACPVFGGKLKSYDFNAIKDRPGVYSAVAIDGNGPRENADFGTSGREYRYAAVAVVADTWWRAKTALDALPIEWDVGADGRRNTDDLFQADAETLKQPGTIVLEEGGSYEDAKSKAAKVVAATYKAPFLAHARMEPGNATAMVTPGRVDVWTGDQSPQFGLLRAADEAGVTPDKVFIHTTFLGGGYGGGGGSDQVRQAVAIAKTLNGRPVKVLWSREEDMRLGEKYRPMGIGRFEATLDADGWPLALRMRTNGDRFDRNLVPAGTHKNLVAEQAVRGLHELPYFFPTVFYDVHTQNSHVPVGFRLIDRQRRERSLYLESFVDAELAHRRWQGLLRVPARADRAQHEIPQPRRLAQGARYGRRDVRMGHRVARGLGARHRRRRPPARAAGQDRHLLVCRGRHRVDQPGRIAPAGARRCHVVADEGFSFVNPSRRAQSRIEGQIAWAPRSDADV